MGGFGASFLDSYMKAFQTGMERKRMETEQQQFKDRLQWEQAKQAQEFGLRQQEAAQQKAYQNAMLGIQQRQLDEATLNRQQQALEKFGEKGGQFFAPFTRRDQAVTMPSVNIPTAPGAMGVPVPLPPELQQALQRGDTLAEPGLDLGAGPAVPAMPTQIFQTGVSPEIQRQIFMQPDVAKPPVYTRDLQAEDLAKKLGMPAQEAYRITPFGKAQEEKAAQTEASQMPVTEQNVDVFKEFLGDKLKVGDTVDARQLPIIERFMAQKAAREAAAIEKEKDRDLRRELEQQHNETLRFQASLNHQKPDISGYSAQMERAPEAVSTKGLDKETKAAVMSLWNQKYPNTAFPVDLTNDQKQTLSNANGTLRSLDTINSLLDDPDVVANLGPLAGLATKGTMSVGDVAARLSNIKDPSRRNQVAAQLVELNNQLTLLSAKEARALFGRTGTQTYNVIKGATPRLAQNPNEFRGALRSIAKNQFDLIHGVRDEQFSHTELPKNVQDQLTEKDKVSDPGLLSALTSKNLPTGKANPSYLEIGGLVAIQGKDGKIHRFERDSKGNIYEVRY